MNKLFTIQRFNTKYQATITAIGTQIDISKPLFGLFDENSVQNKNPVERKRAEKIAKRLIDSGKLRTWEVILEKMFSGESRFSLGSALPPLMLLAINDLFKADACMPASKEQIDQLYRKFTLLQFDLTNLHASAYFLTGGDPTAIKEKYEKLVAYQVCMCVFLI